jgi:mono/diheme cytochrome c family protein
VDSRGRSIAGLAESVGIDSFYGLYAGPQDASAAVGLEERYTTGSMHTKYREAPGNAARVRRPLLVCLSVLSLAGCGELPGIPQDGGYEAVAYRERESIGQPAQPNPPPVVAGIGGAGGGAIPALPAGAPAGVTQAMVEEGAQQFGTVCSACHGAAGAGTPAAPALNDAEWLNISGAYDEIVNVIHTGVASPEQYPGAMPPLGGGSFNDEQVRAIAAYVFALSNQ